MVDRYADDVTVADLVKLRKENGEMKDILKDIMDWCKELEVFAEDGSNLVPVLQRACDWVKTHDT